MSKQQRDAIDAAMRAEPFDLSQSTAEHRKAPEGTHVFQFQFGALDEADEAIDEVARFFKRHLS